MATAYHAGPHGDAFSSHWEQSVPLPDENTPYQNQNLFQSTANAFPSLSHYPPEAVQPDYSTLRDSSRSLKTQRSGNMIAHPYEDKPARDSRPSQTRRPSAPSVRTATPGRKPSVGAGMNAEDTDDSAWIHRDKLAQIESREMAQAGIRVRHSSRHRESASENRSTSRSASRADTKRSQSRERFASQSSLAHDAVSSTRPPFQELARYDLNPRDQAEQYYRDDDDTLDYDPAMLQDISGDRGQHGYSRSVTRPSTTSRIPVARASPAPISNAVVERDSPLPRSRAGSNAFSVDNSSYKKHRVRSQSLGSQGVMDEVMGTRPSTSRSRPQSSHIQSPRNSLLVKDSPQSSPPKAKTASRQASSLNNRKGNTSKPGPRSRATSSARKTSPGNRPTTSSATRPLSASKRPEGDAPWIATMYKPDPRIPQDQQILPTHAKRMMNGDGEIAKAYDRDFNLLDDNDLAKMGAFPAPSPQNEQDLGGATPTSPRKDGPGQEPPWPLSPTSGESRAGNSTPRPGTSGGYKITPTIAPPNSPPSTMSVVTPNMAEARKQSVQRVPDLDEKESGKKDKSCGCCIVM